MRSLFTTIYKQYKYYKQNAKLFSWVNIYQVKVYTMKRDCVTSKSNSFKVYRVMKNTQFYQFFKEFEGGKWRKS